MANEITVQERDARRFDKLRGQLEAKATDFSAVLPSHITPAQFQRTVLTAVQHNPDLILADRASFLTSCMKCAQDSLLPDGREAALVVYNVSKKEGGQWIKIPTVQYLPMVYGLRKKILQSGRIKALRTNVVYRSEYENGQFFWEEGAQPVLRHRPDLMMADDERQDAEIVAAYSVAILDDGSEDFCVVTRAELNKIQNSSQTGSTVDYKGNPREPKGPWKDWYPEQAKKSAMRRHSKTLPMSGDLLDVEAIDEVNMARRAKEMLTAPEEETKALSAPIPRRAVSDDVDYDAETGEILDAEDQTSQEEREAEEQHRQTIDERPRADDEKPKADKRKPKAKKDSEQPSDEGRHTPADSSPGKSTPTQDKPAAKDKPAPDAKEDAKGGGDQQERANKAEGFVEAVIGRLENMDTPKDVKEFWRGDGVQENLPKLQKDFPPLHQKILDAYNDALDRTRGPASDEDQSDMLGGDNG